MMLGCTKNERITQKQIEKESPAQGNEKQDREAHAKSQGLKYLQNQRWGFDSFEC